MHYQPRPSVLCVDAEVRSLEPLIRYRSINSRAARDPERFRVLLRAKLERHGLESQ
ncbi:hypothetical protein ACQUQP_08830 [Marinobacterium sp. YM272]|uniref:hypothetical protein n=1 Tax=Marinobacterium sp. YM272 TaxID=3421654 RepID=UPI003D7F9755